MSSPDISHSSNLLLRMLSESDRALLAPHLVQSKLEREQVLVTANAPIDGIFFLDGGIASVVADLEDTAPTEIGIIGREGVTGVAALLGAETSPNRTFIQIDGSTAWRMDASRLRAAMGESPSLMGLLLRYVQTFLLQVSFSTVANAHHRMEARLARWLLMCQDRMECDEFKLTHEFMAMMIGAQRTGVTVTLHILEGGGAIRSQRGRVTILDRARLVDLAGEAYVQPEAEYQRLIGPFGYGTGQESASSAADPVVRAAGR